jgi:hypothetical protein
MKTLANLSSLLLGTTDVSVGKHARFYLPRLLQPSKRKGSCNYVSHTKLTRNKNTVGACPRVTYILCIEHPRQSGIEPRTKTLYAKSHSNGIISTIRNLILYY